MVTKKYSTEHLVCTLKKDRKNNTMYYLICENIFGIFEVPVCIWYNPDSCLYSSRIPEDYDYIYKKELEEIFIWLKDEYPVFQYYLFINKILSNEEK